LLMPRSLRDNCAVIDFNSLTQYGLDNFATFVREPSDGTVLEPNLNRTLLTFNVKFLVSPQMATNVKLLV